jgi:hypothetical protein
MRTHSFPGLVVAVMLGAMLTGAIPVRAQMVGLQDKREVFTIASVGLVIDDMLANPPAPFAYWTRNVQGFVNIDEGWSQTDAGQHSEFTSNYITAVGNTQGGRGPDGGGSYEAYSRTSFRFRVDSCLTYTLSASVYPNDGGIGYMRLSSATSGLTYHQVTDGEEEFNGQLAPGEYLFEAMSHINASLEFIQGPGYDGGMYCLKCSASLIRRPPSDTTLVCGSAMTLSVIPTLPVGNTYQWRRNLVPLANSAHISGATTPNLTINAACVADVGWYDVVVTNGATTQASRLAHLGTPPSTGVAPVDAPGPGAFTLSGAVPNPSTAETSFRYAAPRPVRIRAGVYDVSGRLIRPIADRMVAEGGSLAWDGRTAAGTSAPAGVYVLRVTVDGREHIRRFARIR